MKNRVLLVVLALLVAAVCVRLGVWQLHRLGERRQRNALLRSRLDSAVVDVGRAPRDPALARFRRVRVRGVADYGNELVVASRTHDGSPGVNLLTPVRLAGDTAVLLNRGWVYAADGASIDRARWRESGDTAATEDPIDLTGYVVPFDSGGRGAAVLRERDRILRRADGEAVRRALPYPVLPFYVVAMGDSASGPGKDAAAVRRPERVPVPALDEGNHLSYAIQWFSFAAIALVGTAVVVRRRDRES